MVNLFRIPYSVFCQNRPRSIEDTTKTFWLLFFLGHDVYYLHTWHSLVCSTAVRRARSTCWFHRAPVGSVYNEDTRRATRGQATLAVCTGRESRRDIQHRPMFDDDLASEPHTCCCCCFLWTIVNSHRFTRPVAKGWGRGWGPHPPPEKPPQKILGLHLAVLADFNH